MPDIVWAKKLKCSLVTTNKCAYEFSEIQYRYSEIQNTVAVKLVVLDIRTTDKVLATAPLDFSSKLPIIGGPCQSAPYTAPLPKI